VQEPPRAVRYFNTSFRRRFYTDSETAPIRKAALPSLKLKHVREPYEPIKRA
jgi:hypothetical protein